MQKKKKKKKKMFLGSEGPDQPAHTQMGRAQFFLWLLRSLYGRNYQDILNSHCSLWPFLTLLEGVQEGKYDVTKLSPL